MNCHAQDFQNGENTLRYYNNGSMTLYICPDPQNIQHKNEPYRLQMIMICQYRFILVKKKKNVGTPSPPTHTHTTLLGDVDNEDSLPVCEKWVCGKSTVPSSQFCCIPNTALKN